MGSTPSSSGAQVSLWDQNPGPPRCVEDAVTPLHAIPYREQVERKDNEMRQVVKRAVRRVRKLWQKEDAIKDAVELPAWLVPLEGATDTLARHWASLEPHHRQEASRCRCPAWRRHTMVMGHTATNATLR